MTQKHTCSNGVRILLEKIPTVRSVTIGVWIGTGSRHETERNNGISHFIEHMLFKGTAKRSARDIAEAFDQIGGQVNAFTSKEYTCYYARVLDEHALYAVDVLSDMFFHSALNEGELKKEKQVVNEEIKMYEDTPDDLVHDLLSEASYGQHPLGYPILGIEETLNKFHSDDLRNYMNNYYTPNNIVVSIAGNVDESIIESVDATFSQYDVTAKEIGHEAPVFHSGKLARKKETEQAHICLGFKGIANGNESVYPLIVMNNILGGSMSSRLFQEVREDKGLAYSIFSYHTSYRDSGLLTVYGGTGAEQLDQLYDTVLASLDHLVKKGVSERELRNSKEQIKGNMMLSLESTSSRMSRNAKNELILGRDRPMDEMSTKIDLVSLSDVHEIAASIFNGSFSCSVISPSGALPKAINK
ncbi:putative Zn-dependent peptidase [Scopulibacillus darangshiensis]|uniref:Putative Zn-dependent peptidase n=1 Tax=Scopulibacillus darangshiensis TaxID=442528 RepID=A0A4R2P7U2_9BACL|nr:pitrilysin family protein [Scopulibacillus darangshiensis]TCP30284.1 putative Zn-dependent peptidase [Scopulibacillus darangshiensis]